MNHTLLLAASFTCVAAIACSSDRTLNTSTVGGGGAGAVGGNTGGDGGGGAEPLPAQCPVALDVKMVAGASFFDIGYTGAGHGTPRDSGLSYRLELYE